MTHSILHTLQVPITLYFMTHAYFCFYHTVSNLLLRRVMHATEGLGRPSQLVAMGATIFLLSYATALAETITIAHFPYYTFKVGLAAARKFGFAGWTGLLIAQNKQMPGYTLQPTDCNSPVRRKGIFGVMHCVM